jgi:pimeloyl-ACP methyl ester carboxylesterase
MALRSGVHHTVAIPIGKPALMLLGSEPWRAAKEFASLQSMPAHPAPKGDGHPVLIFPGLGAGGVALTPLRKHCEALGYTAFDWGRGRNTGPQGNLDVWMARLAAHAMSLLARFEQTATLIGWSLGGLYARELAKLLQPRVRQVITIGTPFNASADHTHAGWLFRLLSGSGMTFNRELSARLRGPPPVPTTSIYSRSDGVVAWQTCRHEEESNLVQDIEIDGSHLGMCWNPAVLNVVADRLAQRPGQWRPYAGNGSRTSQA